MILAIANVQTGAAFQPFTFSPFFTILQFFSTIEWLTKLFTLSFVQFISLGVIISQVFGYFLKYLEHSFFKTDQYFENRLSVGRDMIQNVEDGKIKNKQN